MSDPDFKVGDAVEFWIDSTGCPKWDHNVLCRYEKTTFRPQKATVEYVDQTFLEVSWDDRSWCWPLKGHHTYSSDQWDRPGYLRKVGSAAETAEPTPQECTCDSCVSLLGTDTTAAARR